MNNTNNSYVNGLLQLTFQVVVDIIQNSEKKIREIKWKQNVYNERKQQGITRTVMWKLENETVAIKRSKFARTFEFDKRQNGCDTGERNPFRSSNKQREEIEPNNIDNLVNNVPYRQSQLALTLVLPHFFLLLNRLLFVSTVYNILLRLRS